MRSSGWEQTADTTPDVFENVRKLMPGVHFHQPRVLVFTDESDRVRERYQIIMCPVKDQSGRLTIGIKRVFLRVRQEIVGQVRLPARSIVEDGEFARIPPASDLLRPEPLHPKIVKAESWRQ